MKVRMLLLTAVLPLAIHWLAGCASVPSAIPVGEWAGHGTYVDYESVLPAGASAAQQTNPAPSVERSKDAGYETTLKIARTRAFGRDALAFSILSKRGKLFNVPDEETKIEMTLLKLQTLANGSTLYAVFGKGIHDSPEGDPDKDASLPPGTIASAMSIQTSRALIVQVHYFRPKPGDPSSFSDTFHFEPDRVVKTGGLSMTKESSSGDKVMRVWWAEELRAAR